MSGPEGELSYSIQWTHSRPTPAAVFAVYAIPQGIVVADANLGGMGGATDPPPASDSFLVLIASDSTGMFGHQCPLCKGYWRSDIGVKICPYCGFKGAKKYYFLTGTQRRYVKEYCSMLLGALNRGEEGKYVIDMDEVAEAAGKDCEKPAFYYAEECQQNLFKCNACGKDNDVLGTYAYCSSCGTRNDPQELEKLIQGIRDRINTGGPYETCVKEIVAAFDFFARQYANQLLARVPLTPARKDRLEKIYFS